ETCKVLDPLYATTVICRTGTYRRPHTTTHVYSTPHINLLRTFKGGRIDFIIANLLSELLIEILPKLKVARWMILSGILRNQESDVTHALMRHKIDIVQVRRRGKWVAILTSVR